MYHLNLGRCGCLQWTGRRTSPIVLVIFPSLTGSSSDLSGCIAEAQRNGWAAVVLNRPGHHCHHDCNWSPFGNPEQTRTMIDCAQDLFPRSRALAVGISAGGVQLCQYLSQNLDQTWILKGATVSSPLIPEMYQAVPWRVHAALTWKVANKFFWPSWSWEWGKPFALFANAVRARSEGVLGGSSIKLDQINIPLLVIHSKDDPLFPFSETWKEKLVPKVGDLALFDRGGHVDFEKHHGKKFIETFVTRWFGR